MKQKILQKIIIGSTISATLLIQDIAQAGYEFPVVITKSVCISRIQSPAVDAGIQDLVNEGAVFLKEACEDRSGISEFDLFELVSDGGVCGFGLQRYKYTLTAKCYIP
jgi:hypothetical protein